MLSAFLGQGSASGIALDRRIVFCADLLRNAAGPEHIRISQNPWSDSARHKQLVEEADLIYAHAPRIFMLA